MTARLIDGSSTLLDRTRLRGLTVDANDGIIATAGIVEGFIGAGAGTTATLIAAVASMVAGGIALGGARYAEDAVERDAQLALIEEERRQHALSPGEELAELTAIYEAKGLSPELAGQVAVELSRNDPLAAHVDAELGLEAGGPTVRPLANALFAAAGFAIGSVVVLLSVALAPRRSAGLTTLLAVAVSLTLSSFVLARWGNVPVGRTLARNLAVGISAIVVTFTVGSLFHL